MAVYLDRGDRLEMAFIESLLLNMSILPRPADFATGSLPCFLEIFCSCDCSNTNSARCPTTLDILVKIFLGGLVFIS